MPISSITKLTVASTGLIGPARWGSVQSKRQNSAGSPTSSPKFMDQVCRYLFIEYPLFGGGIKFIVCCNPGDTIDKKALVRCMKSAQRVDFSPATSKTL